MQGLLEKEEGTLPQVFITFALKSYADKKLLGTTSISFGARATEPRVHLSTASAHCLGSSNNA